MKFDILKLKYIWKNSVEKIQVSWKSDSNNGYCMLSSG